MLEAMSASPCTSCTLCFSLAESTTAEFFFFFDVLVIIVNSSPEFLQSHKLSCTIVLLMNKPKQYHHALTTCLAPHRQSTAPAPLFLTAPRLVLAADLRKRTPSSHEESKADLPILVHPSGSKRPTNTARNE